MADLLRIKQNVSKMVNMGAPEQDIDDYISEEGVSLDDVKNFRSLKPSFSGSKAIATKAGGMTTSQNPFVRMGGNALIPYAGLVGMGEDLIKTPAAHFTNQYLMNAPRSISRTTGNEFAEQANSPLGSLLAKGAGVAGAMLNPLSKMAGGIAQAPLKLANLLKLAGVGAAGGAAYSPSDNFGDMKQRGVQAGVGAITPVGGEITSNILSKIPNKANLAGRIINSLIKPLQKDFSYGKNPGLAVAQEGLVANNLDELASKIGQRRTDIGKQIRYAVKKSTEMVNTKGALRPIDVALARARQAPNSNAALITRLEGVKEDLIGIMGGKDIQLSTPQLAFKMKQKIGDLTKWTGNVSDDKLVNKSLKMVYGRLKGGIEKAVPGIKGLNDRYANLTSAEVATKYRDVVNQRQGLMKIQLGLEGGIAGFILSGGQTLPAVLTGLSAEVLGKALKSPGFKTRIASALAKRSPQEIETIFSKMPQLKDVITQAGINLPSRIIDSTKNE